MARATFPKPHVTLDMKGAACPGPLLGARRVLDELLAGEVMLLISDCPATKDDLFSWPNYADVEILKTRKMAQGGTGYYIRKGKGRRVSPHAVLDIRGATCPGPIVEAKKLLAARGISARVVSVPCFELLMEAPEAARRAIIGDAKVKVGVEAAIRQGWDAIIGSDGIFVGMNSFGASAPYKELYKKFGITAEAVAHAALGKLGKM